MVPDWDASRQVTLTVADPDGSLAPWGMGDPLGAGGSRLHIAWVSGLTGTRVPLGIWRIRGADPRETWRVYNRQDGTVTRVPGGGSVTVQADEDATATALLDRMDAEMVGAPTVLAEVTRLMSDIAAVAVDPGVTDRPMPSGWVYEESRLDAVEDLLSTVGAVHRCGPDGSLQVVPESGVGPVWTIAGERAQVGGEVVEQGVQIDTVRSLSDQGVYNAVISTGETEDGKPLVGRAYLTGGPLAWEGPYGRVPMWHQSVAKTQTGVQQDAATLLENRVARGEVELAVTCLTHPGLQVHDRVVVVAATTAGDEALEGRVVSMAMRSATSQSGTTPAKAMSLGVAVSTEALEAVARRVRRG
jgi:hypothetical protein